MLFSLRDYQLQALEEIREKFRAGQKKVLLYGMTGFGKSEVFCWIAQEMATKEKYCFVVTRGRELVYNAHERLVRRGIDAGILMAGNEFVTGKYVYVISIDTLNRRRSVIEHLPDLIVIDEVHFGGALSFKKLAESYPDSFYLGVTATPWQKESIEHLAETWVAPITYDELVGKGFLVPSRTFAPIHLDLKGVKTTSGDYVESELARAMDKRHIYGNIMDSYVSKTGKATALCFCVNVQHSKNMTAVFNANGIRSQHLDAHSDDETRKDAIRALRNGTLDVITNCNILSTGVDIPELRAVLSARPTKSRILWVQQAGRGSRPSLGKEFFWLMDHSNNVKEHGFIEEFVPPMLRGQPRYKKLGVTPTKTCPRCLAVVRATEKLCPYCQSPFKKEEDPKAEKHAEMEEVRRITYEEYARRLHMKPEEKEYIESLTQAAYIGHYKRSFIYVKARILYGDQRAKQLSARAIVDHFVTQIELSFQRKGMEKPRGFRKNNPWCAR